MGELAQPGFLSFASGGITVYHRQSPATQVMVVQVGVGQSLRQPNFFNFAAAGITAYHRQRPAQQEMVVQIGVGRPLRQGLLWHSYRGVGVISGVLSMPGAYPKRAVLIEQGTGGPIAMANVGATGQYTFTDLGPGTYAVVPIDTTETYRSKVVHTVVP